MTAPRNAGLVVHITLTMLPHEEHLASLIRAFDDVAIAVSGGVDSLTLAAFAHTILGDRAHMYHAVSPAVPPEATRRTRELAELHAWPFMIVDAGEFHDERYRSNPVNRCFFCKSNLYAAIATRTGAQILSGANADDLKEYRPGLEAAANHGVRHPFVEAGMSKAQVRALARSLGLGEISDIPAAPCLSSRVETGIRIDERDLGLIHQAETAVRALLPAAAIRCRVRRTGVVIEIDATSLASASAASLASITAAVTAVFGSSQHRAPIAIEPYRTGSAFLQPGA